MPQTIHFNTGRRYTDSGQRITATLHDDGVVTFMDHDRGIHGTFDTEGHSFTASLVMNRYDHNAYKNSSMRGYTDGMMAGGCNTKWEG